MQLFLFSFICFISFSSFIKVFSIKVITVFVKFLGVTLALQYYDVAPLNCKFQSKSIESKTREFIISMISPLCVSRGFGFDGLLKLYREASIPSPPKMQDFLIIFICLADSEFPPKISWIPGTPEITLTTGSLTTRSGYAAKMFRVSWIIHRRSNSNSNVCRSRGSFFSVASFRVVC